ncbi:HNH endonuclease signature motif containing protein [Micromonospora sp. WMMD980]|uniref:HNH endonuclease signature motif containing protein n=1 Tax=Micromonospora sp. WMMD980 TaxID=3016088 RepID=UPI0024159DE9|nr:HNH endonuclease signature motif containing protein [Micromonospora sp. WMMD980]MDG4798960.1 HNH endonuclease signature motif containing protein [Micromonospora sp. WMMD980]MDG4798967.1 HNH endonuclease signature motif containing protein [Micromonospora sp. WMMD980]MDG4799026.1 HNH endonuclease signature motif containing protein [Micromonospora sp. WMMD980]
MTATTLERLRRGFVQGGDDECWLWHRAKDPFGYGRIWHDGGMRLAHRVMFELHRGPVPEGLVLDHLCRVTSCVNPAHLEPVAHAVNVRRGNSGRAQAARTHCPRGHEYTEDNTHIGKSGSRFCRTCDKSRSQDKNRIRNLRRRGVIK